MNVGRAALGCRVARFTFTELCGTPSGAADYITIGNAFHTIFLEGVPEFHIKDINLIRRFILLVDTLYEQNVKLICLAAAEPDRLFVADGRVASGYDAKDETANAKDEFGMHVHAHVLMLVTPLVVD